MELPARIGKYELLEFLGGGMSHVYRARDTVIGRTVAVKILTESACLDHEAKTRFLAEAKMAGNVAHDNIISIHDYGEDQGRPFIVMEFLIGEDLRHAIKNSNTGDLRNKMRIALQVARALEFVHSKRIIHRDIKPENIHLDAAGKAKLMDFGIAKSENLSLTKTGFALGTPYYMAPEQVLGKPLGERTDVYSFGLVLYELLAGTRGLTGDTMERLFYQILHEPLSLAPLEQTGVPQPIIDIVARSTAKEGEQRTPSFTVLCAEIEKVLQDMEGPARPAAAPPPAPAPEPPPQKDSRLGLMIGAAVVVLAVAGTAAYYMYGTGGKTVSEAPRVPAPPPATLSLPSGDMVLVAAGSFLAAQDKVPSELPAFYIDRTEVTNAAYASFCEARQRPLPPDFPSDRRADPIVNITIVDAREFAKWAGKRLPSALEWEKAARGADGRIYAWGNDSDPNRANVAENPQTKGQALMAADSLAAGASPCKALHMSGNASEFVDDLRTPSPAALAHFTKILNPPATATEPWYTIRGGAFNLPIGGAVAYEWSSIPARFAAPNIGFRCAKDP